MVAPSCAYQAVRWTVSLILRESSEGICSRSARNEKDLFETRKSVSSNSRTAARAPFVWVQAKNSSDCSPLGTQRLDASRSRSVLQWGGLTADR
jgi:hypothetical protein